LTLVLVASVEMSKPDKARFANAYCALEYPAATASRNCEAS